MHSTSWCSTQIIAWTSRSVTPDSPLNPVTDPRSPFLSKLLVYWLLWGAGEAALSEGKFIKENKKMKRHWDDREKREFLKVTLGSECEALHFLTSRQLVISLQDDSNKKSRFLQGLYSLSNAVILGQFVWHFKQEGRWRGEKTPRRKNCYLPSHLFLIHKDGDAPWGERVTYLWPFSACLPTSTSKNTLLPWLLPWVKDHLVVCKSALWLLCFFFFLPPSWVKVSKDKHMAKQRRAVRNQWLVLGDNLGNGITKSATKLLSYGLNSS